MADREAAKRPFLSDVKTLRERARQHLSQGAITPAYKGDVKQAIALLQTVLATEIVCVLRYTMHSIAANGVSSEAVRAEFAEHAREEQEQKIPTQAPIRVANWAVPPPPTGRRLHARHRPRRPLPPASAMPPTMPAEAQRRAILPAAIAKSMRLGA